MRFWTDKFNPNLAGDCGDLMSLKPSQTIRGFEIYQSQLDGHQQKALTEELRQVAKAAPMFSPITPSGHPMSVRMTSAGALGWVADRRGYRYQTRHPNGVRWPPIPPLAKQVWHHVTDGLPEPDTCLINLYLEKAKMGMHCDRDEADFQYPVVSISLGDEALFRIGHLKRGGSTESIWLKSGDVVVMGGEARLRYHGIDGIRFNSSSLLPNGGRLNVTLRIAG